MILFLFLLLVVIAFGILAIRRQSYFQHREMMRSVNPELLAKQDAEEDRGRAKLIKVFSIVLGVFGLLFLLGFCQQFKGFGQNIKIESNEPAKTP